MVGLLLLQHFLYLFAIEVHKATKRHHSFNISHLFKIFNELSVFLQIEICFSWVSLSLHKKFAAGLSFVHRDLKD